MKSFTSFKLLVEKAASVGGTPYWLLFPFLLFLSFEPTQAATIRIRVVDGRSGNPITQNTIVWSYDENGKQILRSYSDADLHRPPSELNDVGAAVAIGISSNGYFDCRNLKYPENLRTTYSVKEIAELGIVTSNLCGKVSMKPEPGVLIFFVRPPNWFERHRE